MSQANVYTTVSAQAWYTDKARISTGTSPVTYNVNVVYPSAVGNIYSAPTTVPANSFMDVFVGVGNQLTITGSGFTAQELGTTSSGSYSVRQA